MRGLVEFVGEETTKMNHYFQNIVQDTMYPEKPWHDLENQSAGELDLRGIDLRNLYEIHRVLYECM